MNSTELVTQNDIEKFKTEILEVIKEVAGQLQTTGKKWLRNKEVMKMLGLSASGLQNLRINGTLPYTKLGGIIYYDLLEINTILDRNKIK